MTSAMEFEHGFPAQPSAETAPADRWIQTVPGRGWFCYFRIYGPEAPDDHPRGSRVSGSPGLASAG